MRLGAGISSPVNAGAVQTTGTFDAKLRCGDKMTVLAKIANAGAKTACIVAAVTLAGCATRPDASNPAAREGV